MELFALSIHWSSWYRLEGEPDQLYVWIAPIFLAVIAFGLIIAGTLRSFSFAGRDGLKGSTNNA